MCNIKSNYTEGEILSSLFDVVYKIMLDSFPMDEIRSYEGQKALLSREDYHLKTYEKEGQLLGFCAYYMFDDFLYIEHLACTPSSRGLGIGTKLIETILEEATERRVILEVEPPVDEMTKRRVQFYERLGFTLNPYKHYQAPLNPTTGVVELKMMSSLGGLTEEQQQAYRRVLNEKVYLVDPDFMI